MSDDVILAKAQIIERCIVRAREELAASIDFSTDFTRQDAAILNIQRACDAAIDVAFRVTRIQGLGSPANAREAFDLLSEAQIVPVDLVDKLKRMTGFRNVAVHRYTELDIAVVERVIREGLDDMTDFTSLALRL